MLILSYFLDLVKWSWVAGWWGYGNGIFGVHCLMTLCCVLDTNWLFLAVLSLRIGLRVVIASYTTFLDDVLYLHLPM